MSLIIGVMNLQEMEYQVRRNEYENWDRYRWKPYCLWTCRRTEKFFLKKIEVFWKKIEKILKK